MKFQAFVYLLPKKMLPKFQSNRTNRQSDVNQISRRGSFFLTALYIPELLSRHE